MHRGMIFSVVLGLCSLFPIQGWATEAGPVSPAVEMGEALVDTCRPTFSWSQADGARTYEVAVFGLSEGGAYSYEEMEALEEPLMKKIIEAPAFSWTPSTEHGLGTGMKYVWFVRGIDLSGQGVWSKGQVFAVDTAIAFAGIKETIGNMVQEHLAGDSLVTEIVNEAVETAQREAGSGGIHSVSCADSAFCSSSGPALKVVNSGTGSAILGESSNEEGWGIYGRNNHSDNGYAGQFDGNVNTTAEYRINGFRVLGADENNVSVGKNAGDYDTGTRNTFIGPAAGFSHTNGFENTFVGHSAGHNSTGSISNSNTFVGADAGYGNTDGYWNTFVGHASGYYNTTGNQNAFFGKQAGYWNVTGDYNTFVGYSAGLSNTDSESNTFIGSEAGLKNTSGWWNTFVGRSAGHENTEGNANTFIGKEAGYSNTEGNSNLFVGYFAGWSNTSGYYNLFMGRETGYSTSTGYWNTFLGNLAGHDNTSGSANTYVGMEAGYSNKEGNSNVFIGTKAGYAETGSHKLYIANSETGNPLIYGEFDNDLVRINGTLKFTTGYAISDARYKSDVAPLEKALEAVLELQGVSFSWDTARFPDKGFNEARHIGLVAQEVEKVLPQVVCTNRDGSKSVAYDQIVPVLVGAVKEQQLMIENQRALIRYPGDDDEGPGGKDGFPAGAD